MSAGAMSLVDRTALNGRVLGTCSLVSVAFYGAQSSRLCQEACQMSSHTSSVHVQSEQKLTESLLIHVPFLVHMPSKPCDPPTQPPALRASARACMARDKTRQARAALLLCHALAVAQRRSEYLYGVHRRFTEQAVLLVGLMFQCQHPQVDLRGSPRPLLLLSLESVHSRFLTYSWARPVQMRCVSGCMIYRTREPGVRSVRPRRTPLIGTTAQHP